MLSLKILWIYPLICLFKWKLIRLYFTQQCRSIIGFSPAFSKLSVLVRLDSSVFLQQASQEFLADGSHCFPQSKKGKKKTLKIWVSEMQTMSLSLHSNQQTKSQGQHTLKKMEKQMHTMLATHCKKEWTSKILYVEFLCAVNTQFLVQSKLILSLDLQCFTQCLSLVYFYVDMDLYACKYALGVF